jgi:hypothetical protein
LDDLFSVFTAMYPPFPNPDANPLIHDEEFHEVFWNPGIDHRSRILSRLPMRRPLISQKKYIGLYPFSAKEGDEIWILAGLRLPFVLRKAREGLYDLVGEAYVHGFMQGEYFAGGDHVDTETVVLR